MPKPVPFRSLSFLFLFFFFPFVFRKLTFSLQTTKGCGATMVIIDELAYIDEGLWAETIRALMVMKNAGMIGITTPRKNNFVNTLINMQEDDGTPFFNVMHMTTICDACNKLPTLSEKLSCNHCYVPTYKSKAKQARNAKVARATGTLAITAQEDAGLITEGSDGQIFSSEQLRQTFDVKNPAMMFSDDDYRPARIHVLSDPNADGESNTTVFSCFTAPPRKQGGFDRLVMLGIDVKNTAISSEKDELVLRHIKQVLRMYPKTPILFYPENNTGSYATRGEEIVRKLGGVVTVREGGPGAKQPGIRLSETIKADYVYVTRKMLDNAQIVWSSRLFTLSLEYATNLRQASHSAKSDVELMMGGLEAEMNRMRYEKRKITGKIGRHQDDGAITLMMACYWPKAIENEDSEVYEYYRNLVWVQDTKFNPSGQSLNLRY
jgi:hypothetical protein